VQRKEQEMHVVNLDGFELRDVASELDPQRRLRVGFPNHSANGHVSTATVYFELEPGMHVGRHTDSAEELLHVLEGEAEATVGAEIGLASAGTLITVPAMEPHNVLNVGTDLLRVLGFFASSTVVATFEVPPVPDGPQVFVIGAPMPVALPLPEPALA
jgi:quercetin dioxygenase-like cupin family protein